MKEFRVAAVNTKECVGCGVCVKVCKVNAIDVYRGVFARVDFNKCVGCSTCAKKCPACVINMEVR